MKKTRGVPKVPDDARTTGTDGKPRHGDSAIALVLAMFAVEKIDVGEIDYTAAPKRPRGFDNITAEGGFDEQQSDMKIPEPRAW